MTILNVNYDDDHETVYRVTITAPGYKCAEKPSKPSLLTVRFRNLHVPQGFSPDNIDNEPICYTWDTKTMGPRYEDGKILCYTDHWHITGIDYYPNNTISYNRWELKVFEMEGYDNEDPSKFFEGIANYGNTSGKLLPRLCTSTL